MVGSWRLEVGVRDPNGKNAFQEEFYLLQSSVVKFGGWGSEVGGWRSEVGDWPWNRVTP